MLYLLTLQGFIFLEEIEPSQFEIKISLKQLGPYCQDLAGRYFPRTDLALG